MQIVEACLLHPSKGCTVAIPDRRYVNACRDEGIAVWRAAGDRPMIFEADSDTGNMPAIQASPGPEEVQQ